MALPDWYSQNLVLTPTPATKADIKRAVNSLNGNPKPRPTGMFASAPRNTLTAPKETIPDRIQSAARNAMLALGMSPYGANQFGKRAASFLNDLTPVGTAVSAEAAKNDYQRGNYLGALFNGAMTALSAIPDVGPLAGKASHAIIAPLYHGSPHKFDKFLLEKIGTGEGAQAYGHGLYFAENPAVANDYRRNLTYGRNSATYEDAVAKARWQEFEKLQTAKAKGITPYGQPWTDAWDNRLATAKAEAEQVQKPGHLYEVSLDANPEDFLDHDAPLSAQRGKPSDFLNSELSRYLGSAYERQIDNFSPKGAGELLAFTRGINAVSPQFSQEALNAGIPGIRYLDGGSRGAGNGTRNYVVFNPDIIKILNRN